jgi:hypothetical protein
LQSRSALQPAKSTLDEITLAELVLEL